MAKNFKQARIDHIFQDSLKKFVIFNNLFYITSVNDFDSTQAMEKRVK